jgi:hypothetical protein
MKSSLDLNKRPFVLLLLTAIILWFALVLWPIAKVDVQDKVVFGISLEYMLWIVPLVLISFWLLYLTTGKFLYSATLTWVHIVATVITTLLIVALICIGITPSSYISDRNEVIGNTLHILTLTFLSAQLIYIVNVGLGILGRRNASLSGL